MRPILSLGIKHLYEKSRHLYSSEGINHKCKNFWGQKGAMKHFNLQSGCVKNCCTIFLKKFQLPFFCNYSPLPNYTIRKQMLRNPQIYSLQAVYYEIAKVLKMTNQIFHCTIFYTQKRGTADETCTINLLSQVKTHMQCVHTLIMWPLASERTLSYATPQCIGMLLTVYIFQVTWPFDVWK